jgi:hypothetical protein
MPTIAEIIAAKKAAAAGAIAHGIATIPKKPTAADLEVEQAINRIDPPGKRRAGLVVSANKPLAPAEIIEKSAYKEERSLSATQGEAIPMTPSNATAEERTWHEACNAFESELCVMRDPQDSESVWLAVRPNRQGLPPILIHRLPWTLWEHPAANKDPF